MKKSKQSKASKRVDGADNTLSNLPDTILHLILSRLSSTEEAIRTSILSRRWRYLWTSVPSIDIDYSRGSKSVKKFRENKFTEFVYWVLLTRSLDLDSFRLCCSYYYNMSAVGRWIYAAVTRNVKQLHLVFSPGIEKFEMPHCLVTSGSLEVLRLFMFRVRLSLPKITGCPSLRVLELNGIRLYDDGLVKAFFKSLTLLEDLSLIECALDELEFLCISCLKLKNLRIDNREMVACGEYFACGNLQIISCSKLVFLELIGAIAHKFFFDGLDSLKKAVIYPQVLENDYDSEERVDYTLCELFAGISHVESLSISISFLTECIDREVGVRVSLPNLKTLELTIDCMTTDAFKFLKCFPEMESLHLNIFWDSCYLLGYWNLDDAATMRILTRQLKKVEYFYFRGSYPKLDIACLLLEHGNALEEMVLSWGEEPEFPKKSMETMKELSKVQKASSTVKLVALLKGWTDGSWYNLPSKV